MDGSVGLIAKVNHFVHRHLLWFLGGSYLVAGLAPGLGLKIKNLVFADVTIAHEQARISLPTVLLGFLLLNAGLGLQTSGLRRLARSGTTLGLGLAANLLVPIAFIAAVTPALHLWHNPDEVQKVLVGLALVASMPIAGSSTAWTQNANGDMALSLGLVLASTFLSPLTTRLTFDLVEPMATGEYRLALDELEGSGTGVLLLLCVLLPSLLGMVARPVI